MSVFCFVIGTSFSFFLFFLLLKNSLLIYASVLEWHIVSIFFIFIICLVYFIRMMKETYQVDSDKESSNVRYHGAVTLHVIQVLVQPSNKQMKWEKMLHLPACKYDANWITLLLLPFRITRKILVAHSLWTWKMVMKLLLLTPMRHLKCARLVPQAHMHSEWTM